MKDFILKHSGFVITTVVLIAIVWSLYPALEQSVNQDLTVCDVDPMVCEEQPVQWTNMAIILGGVGVLVVLVYIFLPNSPPETSQDPQNTHNFNESHSDVPKRGV